MSTTNLETSAAFAPADDVPIPYMQRTRDYYLALGYRNPYRWAHFVETPPGSTRTSGPRSRAPAGWRSTG